MSPRADLLADLGHRLLRVQIKTGRLDRGKIVFGTGSVRVNTQGRHVRSYVGEVDFIAVHCPQIRESYTVPIDDCATGHGSLRVAPTQNDQRRGVRLAVDYRLRDFAPE